MILQESLELTSCPRQLARQYAVSIDHIFTRRSSEPVITYLPERSKIAAALTYTIQYQFHLND